MLGFFFFPSLKIEKEQISKNPKALTWAKEQQVHHRYEITEQPKEDTEQLGTPTRSKETSTETNIAVWADSRYRGGPAHVAGQEHEQLQGVIYLAHFLLPCHK